MCPPPPSSRPQLEKEEKWLGDPKRKTLDAHCPGLKRLLMKTGLRVGLGSLQDKVGPISKLSLERVCKCKRKTANRKVPRRENVQIEKAEPITELPCNWYVNAARKLYSVGVPRPLYELRILVAIFPSSWKALVYERSMSLSKLTRT